MPTYYEIDVTLLHIRPKIWRRFHLPPEASFGDLNAAVQFCGPWEGGHMWHFREWGRRGDVFAEFRPVGMLSPFAPGEEPVPNADHVPLGAILKRKGDKCIYLYDFGDSWEHEVRLRRIIESDERFNCRLIDGQRNFPPEDCGGVYGYYESLYALGRIEWGGHPDDAPDESDLDDRRDWLGDWDPEAFDLEKTKAKFDRPKPRRSGGAKRKKAGGSR